ncbi:MAG: carbon storage regulator CsrA [Actinobacteria bacterium]|nr:carbon storage regulator CsrA [Actinomycetota bacterium]
MLVLSRRTNESIIINGNITITVLEIRGDHIRIGIDAPRDISIHREEIHAELAKANQDATSTRAEDVAKLPRPAPRPAG